MMINRRRKTRITLYIRCLCVVVIPMLYLIFPLYTETKLDKGIHGQKLGRKLLALLPDNDTIPVVLPAIDVNEDPLTDVSILRNCTNAAILEFPSDGFTRQQRKSGWVILHAIIACYCFWLLAIVCDDYFVDAVKTICSTMSLKEDVVGATFMAAVTSSPELFINFIGTFVTKGDLGVGTVVGSAVFNNLAVPACCGLFAGQVVDLDWWPVSRDCLIYGVAVLSLICVLIDSIVMWYEAFGLVLGYVIYIIAMYNNEVISNNVRAGVARVQRKNTRPYRPFREVTEVMPLLQDQKIESLSIILEEDTRSEVADSPWIKSSETSVCCFILRWPITTALWFTIPDSRRFPRFRFLTFAMCIVWIGMISYIVAFLITIIGDTLNIPDSVMGLTFLAAGTSVPDAVSSIIVTKQGHGAMGLSNSIGSNTIDIFLCLGLPWLLKSYFVPDVPNEHWITLNSSGITYSAVSLLSTLFGLYVAFAANRFRLDWKIGLTCFIMYVAFLVFASVIELNVFFPVNLPTCAQ